MWKNILQPGRPQMTTWGTLIACWMCKALGICNIHCFSTAKVVARTLLDVTFYVHCLFFIQTNSGATCRHELGQDSLISRLKLFIPFCVFSQNCEQRLLYALLILSFCSSVRPSVRMK